MPAGKRRRDAGAAADGPPAAREGTAPPSKRRRCVVAAAAPPLDGGHGRSSARGSRHSGAPEPTSPAVGAEQGGGGAASGASRKELRRAARREQIYKKITSEAARIDRSQEQGPDAPHHDRKAGTGDFWRKRRERGRSTLFVGGLPPDTTTRAVSEFFAPFGQVRHVRRPPPRKGRTRGAVTMAYVELGSPQEAAAAARELNGSDFEGYRLRVNAANDKQERARAVDRREGLQSLTKTQRPRKGQVSGMLEKAGERKPRPKRRRVVVVGD
eukprot:TRINITY_DN6887_c0_g1_i1.p1 TRINITY_DN6887_c0_g1~~TRINITY_DN6887_c0_g1_i1.p1  ORF type:complete len:298 (+),score=77.79 TRINITY_DN6887_c0_g1_i1:86-895(+)